MSALSQEFGLERIILNKDLHEKYCSTLIELIASQYYQKDPSSVGVSYEEQIKYFQEEFNGLFSTDQTQIVTFLYFDRATKELVGTFMLRDAYLFNEKHKKDLKGMDPDDKFLDYFTRITTSCDELFDKYNIKEKQAIYGTNLVVAPEFMKKIKSKGLKLIFTIFVDTVEWICENKIPYGIWTQFKESLILSTQTLFNVQEMRDFEFIGGDKSLVKGKLFLVNTYDLEYLEKAKKKLQGPCAKI